MVSLGSVIENLNQSIDPLEYMVTGFSYFLGFLLFWHGIKKLKDIAGSGQQGGGKSTFVPTAYILGGSALFYLPTAYNIARNTFWGAESPIAYTAWAQQMAEKYGATNMSIMHIIQFIGVVWFIRGIVLLVHASEPGNQHGTKGVMFLVAGIFGMNLQYTSKLISDAITYITTHWFK